MKFLRALTILILYGLHGYAMEENSRYLLVKDGVVSIPQEYISHIKILSVCHKPSLLSCEKADIQLVISALDALKNNNFKEFLNPLRDEYKASCENAQLMPGKLRTLLVAADHCRATNLSLVCLQHLLPQDINQHITSEVMKFRKMREISTLFNTYTVENYFSLHNINCSRKSTIKYKLQSAIVSPAGKFKAVVYDNKVTMYDVTDNSKVYHSFFVEKGYAAISLLVFSDNNEKFAIGCRYYEPKRFLVISRVYIFDMSTGDLLRKIIKNKRVINSIALNSDGSKIAVGSYHLHFESDPLSSEALDYRVELIGIQNYQLGSLNVQNPLPIYVIGSRKRFIESVRFMDDDTIRIRCRKRTFDVDLNEGCKVIKQLDYAHLALLLNLYKLFHENKRCVMKKDSVINAMYFTLPISIRKWIGEQEAGTSSSGASWSFDCCTIV